ncbi:hypothetical protein DTO212C5_5034 [Paecilomyces variotii]|nr:hypothetical protein DTO212C5_5034 [Paecilomyces variotii]
MAPAKPKAQKMSISTFLADESLGSWADEMDDVPLPAAPSSLTSYGGERRTMGNATGFNGYDRDRTSFTPREELPLPTQPPYTAHLGNLSFDATQGDITDLFADCEVTNVRIVEDKLTRTPKGFGYVEFASVEGLKKALTYSGTSFQGRAIRVSVADPPKDRPESTRDFSDWSRKGPLPDLPNARRVSDRPGYGRSFDNVSDAGSDRTSSRRNFEGDGKVRDFGNWERKGPLSPVSGPLREGGRPRSNEGPQFRRSSPAWGEGRSQDGSRPPRREFKEERTPTAPELDNQWRSKMRPDPAPKEPSNPPSPVAAPAPAVRPKLNLQKRTVSEAEPAAPAARPADPKSNPFGAARPIDTAAREREIEEKRQLAIRQKKEADEKAKAEKAEKQRVAKEQAKTEKKEGDANGSKDGGADTPQGAKNLNFEILRRAGEDENGMTADHEAEEKTEEGSKEASKDAASAKTNENWRKSPAQPAEAADDEGWSTVSAKQRNSRRGQSGRAFQ